MLASRARRFRRPWLALLATAFGVAAAVSQYLTIQGRSFGLDRHADLLLHDAALLTIHEHTPLRTPPIIALDSDDPQLRLVTIDEASLHQADRDTFGQYRVSRDLYAKLVERLKQAGARAVAFDLQFPADSNNAAEDTRFAAALAGMPSVLSYELSQGDAGPIAQHLAKHSLIGFVPVQNESGARIAQELTDPLGRKSFSLVTAEAFLHETYQPVDARGGRLGSRFVPLDGEGRLLVVPFETDATTSLERTLGAPAQWIDFARSIELVDVLELPPPELKALFDGTVVVVGPTARGVADFVDTPKGRLPAVFTVLRFVDQLLRGLAITPVPLAVDLGAITGMALLAAIAAIGLALRPMMLMWAAAFIGYTAVDLWLFADRLIWLDLIHVYIAMFTATLIAAFARSALEGDARRRVTAIFAKHTSPEVVHDLIDAELPDSAADFEGRRVYVTVFYSDIRGFTALAEELEPEAVYHQLNEYFQEMCAIVFKYGGYVDKFIGDALMAIFSAPNPRPDDAENAVRSALEQQRRLRELNATWAAEGRPTLAAGMGINSGWVIMGHIGSHERVSFTVIGDAVNVAARLESSAEGGHIVIGEATEPAVRDHFELLELEPLLVKGKAQALKTYRVTGERAADDAPTVVRANGRITSVTFESRQATDTPQPHEGR